MDNRLDRMRLAGRVRRHSTLRWAEWANKRKVIQGDLADASEALYALMAENARLGRDRDGMAHLIADLLPFTGYVPDAEMVDRIERFNAYVSCGYDFGAACRLLDARKRGDQ